MPGIPSTQKLTGGLYPRPFLLRRIELRLHELVDPAVVGVVTVYVGARGIWEKDPSVLVPSPHFIGDGFVVNELVPAELTVAVWVQTLTPTDVMVVIYGEELSPIAWRAQEALKLLRQLETLRQKYDKIDPEVLCAVDALLVEG